MQFQALSEYIPQTRQYRQARTVSVNRFKGLQEAAGALHALIGGPAWYARNIVFWRARRGLPVIATRVLDA